MAADKEPTAKRSLSILLVDDEADTLATLAAMLADEGHVVHVCAKATFALEAIQRYKPDVCVLDIVMPGKTGFSIARDVFALKLAVRPVLIAVTGVFTRPGDDVVAKSVGFDYFVRKGAKPNELLRIINRLAEDHPPEAA